MTELPDKHKEIVLQYLKILKEYINLTADNMRTFAMMSAWAERMGP